MAKKNILTFALILLIVFALAVSVNIAVKKVNGVNGDNGVSVFGTEHLSDYGLTATDADGNSVDPRVDMGTCYVEEDGMTISGTATADIYIEVGEVSEVTLKDLDQGDYYIGFDMYTEEPLTLNIAGDNEVAYLYSWAVLTVTADSLDDTLTTPNGFDCEDAEFCGGTIYSPYICSSDGDLAFSGETAVYLEEMESVEATSEDDGLVLYEDEWDDWETEEWIPYARVECYGETTIDLSGDGIISIKDAGIDVLAVSSSYEITLGDSTVITTPQGVDITQERMSGYSEYLIYDANGDYPETVIIESVE